MKRIAALIIILSGILLYFSLAGPAPAYEEPALHGEPADMSAFGISGAHCFTQATLADILKSMEEKESFLAFFGYHSCAWCKCIVPILQELSSERGVEIRFVDIMADENREKADMLALDAYLEDFTLNYQGRTGVNTPRVSAVLEGEELSVHMGTFPGHDPYTQQLSPSQAQELREIYAGMMDAIAAGGD